MTVPTIWVHCDDCHDTTEADWDAEERCWRCNECGAAVIPPPPGGIDARIEGCTCDPEANNDGRIEPDAGWAIWDDCPVHNAEGAESRSAPSKTSKAGHEAPPPITTLDHQEDDRK